MTLGSREVVTGIHAEVRRGRAVAIIGPNGAGKTTLMSTVVGLLRPSKGSVELFGETPKRAGQQVAYVQQSTNFDPSFPVSCLDVVLMSRYRRLGWFRRPGKADKSVARAALARVGMQDQEARLFGKLSGGQRQRVLLARAIAQEAPLLLMDEPFNAVDATTIEMCLEVLRGLRDEGVGILISTHDMDVARSLCDDVLLMDGRQVAFGKKADVLVPDLLRQAFGSRAAAFGDGVVTTA